MSHGHLSGLTRAELVQQVLFLEQRVAAHVAEKDALLKHVTDLQNDGSKRTEASLYRVVRYFHKKFGHPVEHTPKVPDADQVKFRLKLIAEEFFELLAACEIWPTWHNDGQDEVDAATLVRNCIDKDFCDPVVVNLPEMVDAMCDLDWVVEGTRAVFGVLGAPVLAEVVRANMAKEPSQVAAKDAHHQSAEPGAIKPVKPPGWVPPDVRGELLKQGWRPTLRDLVARGEP